MREVIPSKLWIGHAGDLRNPGQLERIGVKALVHLALEEQLPTLSRELLYCHVPLIDGANAPRVVGTALDLTVSLLRSSTPTLICCSAGMSRSPSIAAGALALLESVTPESALARITSGQPHDVSPPLWDCVVDAVRTRQAAQ